MNPSDQASSPWQETLRDCFEQIRYAQATDLARAGRYLEAEALLMPHGQHPIALRELDLLARICAQQRQYERARNYWEAALQKSPGNTDYQRAIARAAEAQQRRASMRKVERTVLCTLLLCFAVAGVWAFRQQRHDTVANSVRNSPAISAEEPGTPSPSVRPPPPPAQPANVNAPAASPSTGTPGSIADASASVPVAAPTAFVSPSPSPPVPAPPSASPSVTAAPTLDGSPTIPPDKKPSL